MMTMDVLQQRKASGKMRQSFVTMRLNGQLFGASVMHVQDIIRKQQIMPIPLAPSIIEGSLNLRGRIVTVINMYERLRLPSAESLDKQMHVVIEYQHELYSLLVDEVGDVLSMFSSDIDKVPAHLSPGWREVAQGIYRLDDELLVLLDVDALLAMAFEEA